tara:strand:- start:208 stop:513 length:306 start_codon:yes stop_codon:yes gene_type:complete
MINKVLKAIKAINPDADVSVGNDSVDDITWLNGTAEISKSDIETKMNELKSEYDAQQWKRNRQAEYPSQEDCIHALLDGGDTLTDLQAKRTAVKNKYPKSE